MSAEAGKLLPRNASQYHNGSEALCGDAVQQRRDILLKAPPRLLSGESCSLLMPVPARYLCPPRVSDVFRGAYRAVQAAGEQVPKSYAHTVRSQQRSREVPQEPKSCLLLRGAESPAAEHRRITLTGDVPTHAGFDQGHAPEWERCHPESEGFRSAATQDSWKVLPKKGKNGRPSRQVFRGNVPFCLFGPGMRQDKC